LQVRVSPGDIRARTIRSIDAVDFDYASELGCRIRQISRADLPTDPRTKLKETMFADVGPSLVPTTSPFGRVQRNLNLVLTSGEYGGDMAFLGAGAGGDPTAVAVVSDLMFVAENLGAGSRPRSAMQLKSPKVSCDFETPWYLRLVVRDQPGIIAGIAAILSAHQLNIDAVLQKPGFDKSSLPFVVTLEPCRDAQLHPALQDISALPFALRPCLCLPILR
jgi:homoserine dehydrogenase